MTVGMGETSLVALGAKVWALDLEQTDADASAVKGGIVISIETDVDPDTGEVQRRFVCAEPWQRNIRIDIVNADDVKTVEPMNVAAVRRLIRTAARLVGESKRAVIDSSEARLIDLQHRMKEILG